MYYQLWPVNQEELLCSAQQFTGPSAYKNHFAECSAILLNTIFQCLFWAKRHSSAHSVLGKSLGKSGCNPRVLLELGLHRARLVWGWLWCGFKVFFFFFFKLPSLWGCPYLNSVPSSLWPRWKGKRAGLHTEADFPLCQMHHVSPITCMFCGSSTMVTQDAVMLLGFRVAHRTVCEWWPNGQMNAVYCVHLSPQGAQFS